MSWVVDGSGGREGAFVESNSHPWQLLIGRVCSEASGPHIVLLVEAGDDEMAIDSHPCIIVACLNSPRTGDTPIQMYAKTPSIAVSLYVDATEQTRADYQGYAAVLENCLENLAAIQAHINPQTTVTGLHVHYIEDYQTDSAVEENVYQFGVAFGLVLDLVESV